MNHLFWGLLFVFLNLDLTMGNCRVELTPDFIGYYLMVKGLAEIAGKSTYFDKARPWAMAMTVYSGVCYVLGLFAVSVHLRFLGWCLGLVAAVANLLISWWLVEGVTDMEKRCAWELQGQRLKSVWVALTAITVVTAVFNWIPVLGTLCVIAAFITGICFLSAFHDSAEQYRKWNP